MDTEITIGAIMIDGEVMDGTKDTIIITTCKISANGLALIPLSADTDSVSVILATQDATEGAAGIGAEKLIDPAETLTH